MSTRPSKSDAPTAELGRQTRLDHQWPTRFRTSFTPITQRELDTLGVDPHDCRAGQPEVTALSPDYPVPHSPDTEQQRGTGLHRTSGDTWTPAAVGNQYVRPITRNALCAQ
ncbi:hypothetical protein GA0074695_4198 [Micromonospora viridifaciens]|uniref:Uncharacterized protein n=1 Tax=Micromonospora viridifaciens TaxID=1881 RepID=A0A1C4YEL2_MICVI|nr:hypothetical protein GA0074695_4198 [Micromonospora viridifaciens]